MWNEEAGVWLDYDLINQKPRAYFTPSNLSPLIFGCYNTDDKSTLARKVLAYIETSGIDAFPGGVPASLMQTGEQWDYVRIHSTKNFILVINIIIIILMIISLLAKRLGSTAALDE